MSSVSVSEHGVLTGRDISTNLMRPEGLRRRTARVSTLALGRGWPGIFFDDRRGIVSGRDFSEQDTAGSPLVVAINEEMARRSLPVENPDRPGAGLG